MIETRWIDASISPSSNHPKMYWVVAEHPDCAPLRDVILAWWNPDANATRGPVPSNWALSSDRTEGLEGYGLKVLCWAEINEPELPTGL